MSQTKRIGGAYAISASGGMTIDNELTVTGNLTVNGSTVTNSSTNTTIEDAAVRPRECKSVVPVLKLLAVEIPVVFT